MGDPFITKPAALTNNHDHFPVWFWLVQDRGYISLFIRIRDVNKSKIVNLYTEDS
jgi:hypothetical protein